MWNLIRERAHARQLRFASIEEFQPVSSATAIYRAKLRIVPVLEYTGYLADPGLKVTRTRTKPSSPNDAALQYGIEQNLEDQEQKHAEGPKNGKLGTNSEGFPRHKRVRIGET